MESRIPITKELLFADGFSEDVPGVFYKGVMDVERLTTESPYWEVSYKEHQLGIVVMFMHEVSDWYESLQSQELYD